MPLRHKPFGMRLLAEPVLFERLLSRFPGEGIVELLIHTLELRTGLLVDNRGAQRAPAWRQDRAV